MAGSPLGGWGSRGHVTRGPLCTAGGRATVAAYRSKAPSGSRVHYLTELLSLAAEEVRRLVLPWRVEAAMDAATRSSALTVDEATAREAVDANRGTDVDAPGADDRAISRP